MCGGLDGGNALVMKYDGARCFVFVLLGDLVGSRLGSLVGVEVGLRLLGKKLGLVLGVYGGESVG